MILVLLKHWAEDTLDLSPQLSQHVTALPQKSDFCVNKPVYCTHSLATLTKVLKVSSVVQKKKTAKSELNKSVISYLLTKISSVQLDFVLDIFLSRCLLLIIIISLVFSSVL